MIFLFLRNLSATVIPSLALPMSIIGTFAVMYLLDYSLDNLSLMALTLSVGFVVDDAIVMLENIVRHMEMGKPACKAALDGAQEVGFTIVSMTLSLAAVFIPVLFMGGLVGRLFREFAVTIGAAVLVSGLHLADADAHAVQPVPAAPGRSPPRPGLCLHRAALPARCCASTSGPCAGCWPTGDARHALLRRHPGRHRSSCSCGSPRASCPARTAPRSSGSTEAAEGISYKSMFEHQQAVAAILQPDPNVESFMSSAGGRGSSGGNSGILIIRLKPRSERQLTADELIQQLRPGLNSPFPASASSCRTRRRSPIGGRMSRSQYQFTLQGPDTTELYQYADRSWKTRSATCPASRTSPATCSMKNPQVNVEIDRDKASATGHHRRPDRRTPCTTPTAPARSRRSDAEQPVPGHHGAAGRSTRPDPTALALLYVRSTTGQLVPLNAVARLTTGVGPLSINHSGQLPSVTISFNLDAGDLAGRGRRPDRQAGPRRRCPATISTSFQGTAQAFQSSMKGMGWLLVLAILVIYMVLGILYESFIHPITILSALPFAGFGALLTLMLFDVELSIYAFVGIIMLVGLVKKNGIMMVDFALEAQRTEGKNPHDAIHEACLDPVPPDHDDHDGRPDGQPAHRPGPRRRRRSAPAPGPGRRRRPALLPDPDPLRHAGLLPLHGGPAPIPRPPQAAARRAGLSSIGASAHE